MAILWDTYVTPANLTTFVRNVPVLQNLLLNQILPDRQIEVNEVNIEETTRTIRTAKFRAHDAPVQPGTRDGFTNRLVKLPNVSQMLSKGERERLEIQRHVTGGGAYGPIIQAIYNDAETNARSIQARVELSRGDLLNTGKVTLSELGNMQADFGVPGTNFVNAATLWSDTTNSLPLSDLQTWSTAYLNQNGFLPGYIVLPQVVLQNLMRNAEIRLALATLVGQASMVSRAGVEQLLQAFGLPQIKFVYDSQVVVDGTATRVLPANKVILLPPDGIEVGYTAWGVTATGLELAHADEAIASPAGMVAVIDRETNPPYRETLYVDAAVLPVLTTPRALFVATVG